MYRDVTGWLLDETLCRLDALGLEVEQRPAEYERYEVEGWLVRGQGWLVANGALNLRYARIQSARADIATVMIYPVGHPEKLPIFAAEWVCLGEIVRPGVLDIETAGVQVDLLKEMTPIFMPLRDRWSHHFQACAEVPEWFQEIRTPWSAFFEMEVARMGELREMFVDYLEKTMECFYTRERLSDCVGGREHELVLAYKEHHFVHSPGRKLLSGKLGESWSERFLGTYHFGPAQD